MIKTFKDKIRRRLIAEYRALFSQETLDQNDLRQTIAYLLQDIIVREKTAASDEDKEKIIRELVDEFVGFGPIENLLQDAQVTEIMINGPKNVYVERGGKTERVAITFDSEQQLMSLIYKILSPTRRRVDELSPYTDVSLKDGSRVNIILSPVALDGTVVTIRKFLKAIKSAEDLVALGSLDARMADFLVAAIKAHLNIIFSGATGAGKTTTLNVLSAYIPDNERIITIEDTAELRLNQEHVVRLEGRQANIEGKGEINIRDLFKNTLRMRPDRIILGEIRGAEALDMLQAMCSGHSGSLAVIHADSPRDVIYRLETMVLTSGIPLGLEALHRQIAASVNLIVQQRQMSDGTRKITHIAQINGLQDGQAMVEDIFFYDVEGVDSATGKVLGVWKSTGIKPLCLAKFKKLGIIFNEDIFRHES